MTAPPIDASARSGDTGIDVSMRSHRKGAAVLVGLLAAAAAIWATAASALAFPYLGVDHDEAVYLLQANTFRAGRLFPPAPDDAEVARSLLPWLTAHRGDVYVAKYSPAWPAVLAVARVTTGSHHAAQGLVAAGVVVVTYLLAREVVRDRAASLAAAAFVVLSPFFLLQAPTFLSYLPNVLLLETFALAFARAARTGSRAALGLAGVVLGVAFFTRPFDALIFAVPFVLWLVVARRRTPRRLVADLGVLALGATPGLAATLVFFRAATGHLLRSPFLLDEHDTIGFGARRMLPDDPLIQYGPTEALHGLVRHSVLLSFWCFGGLVLVTLALVGLRRRTSALEPWLALVAVVVPAGYALFWGSYLIAQWEGPWRIGPFYYLPVLVPLAVLGGKGFVRFWRWDRVLAGLSFVGMVAVSASVVHRALDYQLGHTEDLRRIHAPLEAAPLERATVFLPARHLLTPFTHARNVSFEQPVVWAVDRGSSHNLRVVNAFPGRTPYLLEAGDEPELRRLTPVRGERLDLRVLTEVPAPSSATVEVVWRGERHALPVSGRRELPLVLNAEGTAGMPPESVRDSVGPPNGELVVRLLVAGREVASRRVAVEAEGNILHALVPASADVDTDALDVVAGSRGRP